MIRKLTHGTKEKIDGIETVRPFYRSEFATRGKLLEWKKAVQLYDSGKKIFSFRNPSYYAHDALLK